MRTTIKFEQDEESQKEAYNIVKELIDVIEKYSVLVASAESNEYIFELKKRCAVFVAFGTPKQGNYKILLFKRSRKTYETAIKSFKDEVRKFGAFPTLTIHFQSDAEIQAERDRIRELTPNADGGV